jgi:hypothetical protein
MHTVDLLEQAIALAGSLGYRVRQEWLGGSGGGGCEIRGERWLFVDLALTPVEQFAQVLDVLQADPKLADRQPNRGDTAVNDDQPSAEELISIPISHELRRALSLRKPAA